MKTVARVQVLLHRLGKLIKVERIRDLQNSHRSREEQILRVDLLFDVEAVRKFSVEVLRWWLPRCDFKRRFGETLRGGPVIRGYASHEVASASVSRWITNPTSVSDLVGFLSTRPTCWTKARSLGSGRKKATALKSGESIPSVNLVLMHPVPLGPRVRIRNALKADAIVAGESFVHSQDRLPTVHKSIDHLTDFCS